VSLVTKATFDSDFAELKEVISSYNAEKTLVVDVETNGKDPYSYNQICGLGVGDHHGTLTQYYPFRHQQGENLDIEHLKEVVAFLNDSVDTFIGFNCKFDFRFLEKEGVDFSDKKLIDVIVMARLIEPAETAEAMFTQMSLTSVGTRHYGIGAVQYDIDTKLELRKKKWDKDYSLSPPTFLGPYCEKDVELTTRLYNDCLKKIIKSKQTNLYEMQCDLTKVLFNTERRGIAVDEQYAEEAQQKVLKRLDEVEQQILNMSGRIKWRADIPSTSVEHDLEKEFNILSYQQVGKVFNSMGIESPTKTATGADSWDEATLININHPIAGLLRQYRTLRKLNSTYIKPYLNSEIMRTVFCNWGTSTGRLSSRNPNLQNIPRNHFKMEGVSLTDEEAENLYLKIKSLFASKGISIPDSISKEVLETWSFVGDESYDDSDDNQIAIRRLFISRPDYQLISFDYSQMEVRVFLSYFLNEVTEAMLKKQDVDFHTEAAKLAFGITEDDKRFKEFRQMAKAITFVTIYGIGNKKLAEQLGVSPTEAGAYKRQYFSAMKGSKKFFTDATKKIEQWGFVKNRYGRVYKLPKAVAYKAVNYLVQGTSADILSERMIEIDKYLADKQSNILLQVHDEIICEIHNSELDTIPFVIKSLLETNSLDIPLVVDMEICSPSWASKKDFTIPTEYMEEDDYLEYLDK